MNRRSVLFLATVFLTIALNTTGLAFFDSAVDKAEDYMKAKMVPQAVQVLEKEINEDPTNEEAHFLLGQCYLKEGRFRQAEERFESATALKASYGSKVGQIYHSEGMQALRSGDTRKAKILLDQAINYQPSLKTGVAQACLDKGYVDLAILFKPSLQSNVCDSLMDKADKAPYESCIEFYQQAERYCDKDSERFKQAGKRLEAVANKIEKENIIDPRVKTYLDQAKKYNDDVRPYVKEYGPGYYQFILKKGETNGHWIAPITGRRTSLRFEITEGSKFDIILDNGTVVPWNEQMPPEYDGNMMIRAVEDSHVFIDFK